VDVNLKGQAVAALFAAAPTTTPEAEPTPATTPGTDDQPAPSSPDHGQWLTALLRGDPAPLPDDTPSPESSPTPPPEPKRRADPLAGLGLDPAPE
jgi:hypothetical protein